MAIRTYHVTTPLGLWRAEFTDQGLRRLVLPKRKGLARVPGGRRSGPAGGSLPLLDGQEGALGRSLVKALAARLKGKRADLPWESFDLRGQPPFFVRTWKVLYRIPFGKVRTYGAVAAAAGSPRAVRAAGQACGANPIVLFIPCHRVVAASGPGGFGAGLGWKKELLALEGCRLAGR